MVAIVGPSGAGKSTALALIPRLHDVAAGAVRIDGADVRGVTLASLRDAIAYVRQDELLFDDTVAANIALGRSGASEAEIEAAAQAAAARGFIAALPQEFETIVGPGGSGSPAASASGSRSPGRCCATRASCCSTRRPARWTPRVMRRCNRRSPGCGAAGPRSWWPTGSRPCATPIWSWCWPRGGRWSRGDMPTLMAEDRLYARLVKTQSLT